MGSQVRAVMLVLAVLAALAPEWPRYRAERELRAVTSAVQAILIDPARVRDPARALGALDTAAGRIVAVLPADPRPRILSGSIRLVGGDYDGALARYHDALRTGERAEIDLDIGRALDGRAEHDAARAAYTRALWVSPALATEIPEAAQAGVADTIARAAARLRAGTLAAAPPLP